MKYFVAHILKGEAGEYGKKIARQISEQFGTEPLHLKSPPHITVVPPFDWAEPRGPIEALKDAVAFIKRGTFYVGRYDHFHTSTILLSVMPSKEMAEGLIEIRRQFKIFKKEGNDLKELIPHVAVARFLNCNQFSAIWKYLEQEDPEFRNEFDSVALLAHANGRWEIVAEESLR